MTRFISFNLFCLVLFFSLSAASCHGKKHPKNTSNIIIHNVCNASRSPEACELWLSSSSGHVVPTTALQAIQLAMNLTAKNLKTGRKMVKDIQTKASTTEKNTNRSKAATVCLEILNYSEYRVDLVSQALEGPSQDLKKHIKDVRAWMSAALLYQYDVWSALKYVNGTQLVNSTMSFFNSTLIQDSSSALAMIVNYDLHGEDTALYSPPKTERDNFWETSHTSSQSIWSSHIPTELKVDVTVCRGKCQYKTVQKAVDKAPDYPSPGKLFVIQIKEGVYEETVRIPIGKKNIVFLGDGIGKTVITGSGYVDQNGTSTFESATVGVAGDGFMARDLTFKNTAGPNAHQAVAFRSDSDQSVIENCEFIGNQDTLYAHSLRQYYKSCTIQGNVDFIFGNSASFFQDCRILVAPRQLNPAKGEQNAVTAQGRTDPAQSTGFVFNNSIINGTKEYMGYYFANSKAHETYLGRPWKAYSRTVFIGCTLEALINPKGWMPWKDQFALETLYYAEFNSSGPGSNPSKRVTWSRQLPKEHVGSYSTQNFIQAN